MKTQHLIAARRYFKIKLLAKISLIFTIIFLGSANHANAIWSPMSSGTTEELYGVWGSSGSDVFAVGTSGIILHYNGSFN